VKALSIVMGATAMCLIASEAPATQSDLAKFCVANSGGRTVVRYIVGSQRCLTTEKTIFLDRPGYSPRDFAGVAPDEVNECKLLDTYVDAQGNEIDLCVGVVDIVLEDGAEPFEACSVWLEGAEDYLVANEPEFTDVYTEPGSAVARELTYFHPVDGYTIEVDIELLIWPEEGNWTAVGRATNAPLTSRD